MPITSSQTALESIFELFPLTYRAAAAKASHIANLSLLIIRNAATRALTFFSFNGTNIFNGISIQSLYIYE